MTTPEYILDDRFQVLMLAVYDLEWAAPKILLPHEIASFLAGYPADETICCSHNALFDLSILSWRYGWVPGRLQDTLGMTRALRIYPRYSLGAVAKELFGHDSKGDVIHKVSGLDVQGIKNAGLWPEFCTYAMNDVRLCAHIYLKLAPEFSDEEARTMDLVLRAAVCPVLHADVPLLQTHLDELRKHKAQLLRECGYDKAALMSTAQFREALEGLGVTIKTKANAKGKPIPQFSKTDPFMQELLEYDEEDDDTNYKVQTLAMARLSHRSTIEETRCQKFINIANMRWPNCQPMLPVPLRYGGAHTHRLSGEWGLNLQNLPRDKARSRLRASILAPDGHKLITADLAQIEARIVARLSRQEDLLEQFRQGVDVYAKFAERVFGRSVNKITNPNERFIGKTAVLGLGYGCGAERFYRMVTVQARQFDIKLDDLFDERMAKRTVDIYRSSFGRIQAVWGLLDNYLSNYINLQHGTVVLGPVLIESGKIKLPPPSGATKQISLYLRYKDAKSGLDVTSRLYGCKLLENVTQALARLVVMEAALRLAKQGLRFVHQGHDELTFVVPDDQVESAKKTIQTEMVREPDWLPGLPLAVEIGVGQDYGSCK